MQDWTESTELWEFTIFVAFTKITSLENEKKKERYISAIY